jgi:hypothetical protein
MSAGRVFVAPDLLERSVWVVVDPRDFVTGQRLTARVKTSLLNVTAEPIEGRARVYCFIDLDLPAGAYTARVELRGADRAYYFDGATEFMLDVIPLPGQPLKRNPVRVELLPRPAYPFAAEATLARGRVLRTSDGTGIAGASLFLILEGVDLGRRGRTDERGEYVVFFPPATPEDAANAVLKDFNFRLRVEVNGQPPLVVPPLADPAAVVREGTTISVADIPLPGV